MRAYFAHYHPAFFTEVSLRSLAEPESLACWANVWRKTDPAGSPLDLGTGVTEHEWEDGVDPGSSAGDAPPVLERTTSHPVYPPLQRHDDYRTDARTVPVRQSLLDELRTAELPAPRTPA
ncbi:hypothetical protein [Streptomyces sp. NBC_00503]|uniref:hypothetical protein n=1 Tax=Streptomyces sp. NBC_00503 TaxID=2903659 RepID=UPI002E80B469|nr:hypothetical protein [Streptomyces sp. NBC_00503]WUD79258.1 hypothetical protein OG490_00965 [Streptomyces sp. NBC_00503]